MSAGIELQNLRKLFSGRDHSAYAVDGIDLKIGRGNFVTFLGASGCGKTTTLRMIAGLEIPTSGRILRDGIDITDLPATDREMRMVFQDYALFPNMNVTQNVAFGLTLRRMKGRFAAAEVERKAAEFLEIVHLSDHARKMPHQLSGGQKQRVALARALVTDPAVMLFDEPLGSLDANLRKVMQIELIRIHKQLGKTFIYVTHDQDEAMAMSDYIAIMDKGKILQFGTPREIYERPNCRFVATFIGLSNVVDGTVDGASGGEFGIRLRNGDIVRVSRRDGIEPHQSVGLMLRADDLTLVLSGDAPLSGVITDSLFRGSRMEYVVELKGGAGTVHVNHDPGGPVLELGRVVGLGLEPSKAHVLVN
jgi:ABC-type Fe3+/spermidine/putrescine transport system ATPase subunit